MSKKRNKLVGFRRPGVSLRSIKIQGPINYAVNRAAHCDTGAGFIAWCGFHLKSLGALSKPALDSVLRRRAADSGFKL